MKPSDPLGFVERAKASIPIGRDRAAYLRTQYGDENVFFDQEGRAYVRRAPGEMPTIVDDPNLVEAGDIADLAGPSMEAVPGTLLGLATQNPWAAAAADAGGSLLRSYASSRLSGNEMEGGDAMGRALLAGSIGGAAQKAANIFAGMPIKNTMARFANRASDTPEAVRSQALLREADLPPNALTIGEAGGNRTAVMMENMARQMPVSADTVHAYDVARIGEIHGKLERMRSGYSSLSPESSGARAQSAYRRYKDAIFDQRTAQWGKDMAGVSNDTPINASNFRAALESEISEADIIGGSPVVKELERMLAQTRETETLGRIKRTLSSYAKSAAGKRRVFNKVDDRTYEQALSRRLLTALGDDLDEAIEAGVPGAEALRSARSNWKLASQELQGLEQMQLERLIGRDNTTPEMAAKRLISMDRPGEIRNAMTLLESIDPEAASGIRANAIQGYLDKASSPVGDIPISPAKFARAIHQDRGKLQAMLGPGGYSEIRRISDVLGKIADNAGIAGSQTSRLKVLWDLAKAGAGDPTSLPGSVAGLLTSQKIAQAMATRQGREALLELGKRGPISRQGFQALSSLIPIWMINRPPAPETPESALIGGA